MFSRNGAPAVSCTSSPIAPAGGSRAPESDSLGARERESGGQDPAPCSAMPLAADWQYGWTPDTGTQWSEVYCALWEGNWVQPPYAETRKEAQE